MSVNWSKVTRVTNKIQSKHNTNDKILCPQSYHNKGFMALHALGAYDMHYHVPNKWAAIKPLCR